MATECKAIVELSKARRALAAASSFDDVLAIRDKAVAAKAYAQAAQLSLEAMNEAVTVKLLAERKAGEMLADTVHHGGDRKSRSHDATLNLDAIGVNKTQSSRWQRLAAIPEDEFEQFIADAKEAGRELTTAAALKLALGPAPEPQAREPRGLGDCIAALRTFVGQLLDEWPDDTEVFVRVLRDEADAIEGFTK